MKILWAVIVIFMCGVLSCKKTSSTENLPSATGLDYGSAVFYVKGTAYTVLPLNGKTGTFAVFPNTLKINNVTGELTVSSKGIDGESQAGLRYKITCKSNTSDQIDSAFIVIAGLSYLDRFYNLSQSDSIIYPIYNGDASNALPSGNYNLSDNSKLSVNAANGQINIKECIRRGFFDNQLNASWKQQTIKYTINDGSNSYPNSIDAIFYYYNTLSEVPKNVAALMQAHQTMSVGVNKSVIPATTGAIDTNLSSDLSLSKPRPPCIIIVGH